MDFETTLEVYQGPLDLLLHLVKVNEVDILDIPINVILEQYLAHIERMKELDVDQAGEFLVMAALLMEIKSREALPVQEEEVGQIELEDPRLELVRQLLEYKRIRDAAEALSAMEDEWLARYPHPEPESSWEPAAAEEEGGGRASAPLVDLDLYTLLRAYEKISRETMPPRMVSIQYEGETIEEKIERITRVIAGGRAVTFRELVLYPENRADVGLTFLAILELMREKVLVVEQAEDFGGITVRARTPADDAALDAAAAAAEAALAAAERTKQPRPAPWGRLFPWKPEEKPILDSRSLDEDEEELQAGRDGEMPTRAEMEAIIKDADAASERFEASRRADLFAEGGERTAAGGQPAGGPAAEPQPTVIFAGRPSAEAARPDRSAASPAQPQPPRRDAAVPPGPADGEPIVFENLPPGGGASPDGKTGGRGEAEGAGAGSTDDGGDKNDKEG
ncbi:MAG: segregation/condensation protein A [Planctomycetota bacterium]|nr:segregation/condensation protein A [Planctomycetota bacterium]